jgi:hypothetical protein
MSRFRFTNGYSDPETRLVVSGPESSWPDTPLPKRAYVAPEPEPITGETVAILTLYRKHNPKLAEQLLAHLSEWGLQAASRDWAKLKSDRVVAPGSGWHLSPGGLRTAQRIAKELALKVGIQHGFYCATVIRGSSVTVRCICGMTGRGWGTDNGEASAWHQFEKHISEFGGGSADHSPSTAHGAVVAEAGAH